MYLRAYPWKSLGTRPLKSIKLFVSYRARHPLRPSLFFITETLDEIPNDRIEMARRQKTRKRGGGYSINPSNFLSAGNPVISKYQGEPDCTGNPLSVRPGYLPLSVSGGLPGMGMSGGRYEMNPAVFDESRGIVSTPSMATPIGCERGIQNPMNLRGGFVADRYEVGQSDTARLQLQNAGYQNQFQVLSGGVPLTVQTPYAAGSFNRACMTTGGKRSKRTSKKSKRSKRSKRSLKKSKRSKRSKRSLKKSKRSKKSKK